MGRIGIILIVLLLSGCSKHIATCLQFQDGGHGTIKLSAGTFGEVGDVNMTGPSHFSRIPEEMTHNPCLQSAPLGGTQNG